MAGKLEVECPGPLRRATLAAAAAAGLDDGHLCVELVDVARITRLNREHRGKNEPTDVLSFPVDGSLATSGPREIGDVVICPERTEDLEEAVVHGVLHLAGFDHERDRGEMLAVQEGVLADLRAAS